MKIRNYTYAALAAIALAGCAPEYDTDKLPIIIEPEPEITYNGSGKLLFGEDHSPMASTYSWSAENDAITLTFDVDLNEYAANEAWEIGHFYLDGSSISDFLGISSTNDINDDIFIPINPDGSETEWTSYKPGMWVNAEGTADGWSSGVLYWQWYIYSTTSYDYDYASNKGMFIIGGNPGNTAKIPGQTVTSKAVLKLGERTVDFIVKVNFKGDEYVAPTEPETQMDYLTAGNPYEYQAAAQGDHQYSWTITEDALTVNVDAYIPAIEDFVYLLVGIEPSTITSWLGIDDINQLADFEYFYPVEPDGTPGEKWTSNAPGQWVAEDGSATTWSDGKMYWFYNFGDNKYENHYTEGLLCVGTNPGNIADLDGVTVTSRAKMGDKDFIVNVTYHSEYPTKGEGTIGANSYSWELTNEAFNVVANLSKANLDDSWGALGFPINTKYINEYYDITIEDLSFEEFYPVDSEGTPGEKWTSYVPGQWFSAEGNPAGSDGVAFWQYYTSETHDFNLTNLFYIGKNPGGNENKEVGDSYVSKAKLAGHDMIVTVNIVD